MPGKIYGQMIVVYNGIPSLMLAMEAHSRSTVKSTADKIVRAARGFAPVDTGELRDSIHAVLVEAGKAADIEVDALHGPYVEFGTYKMSAKPYLSPAVAMYQDDFFKEVGMGFMRWGG